MFVDQTLSSFTQSSGNVRETLKMRSVNYITSMVHCKLIVFHRFCLRTFTMHRRFLPLKLRCHTTVSPTWKRMISSSLKQSYQNIMCKATTGVNGITNVSNLRFSQSLCYILLMCSAWVNQLRQKKSLDSTFEDKHYLIIFCIQLFAMFDQFVHFPCSKIWCITTTGWCTTIFCICNASVLTTTQIQTTHFDSITYKYTSTWHTTTQHIHTLPMKLKPNKNLLICETKQRWPSYFIVPFLVSPHYLLNPSKDVWQNVAMHRCAAMSSQVPHNWAQHGHFLPIFQSIIQMNPQRNLVLRVTESTRTSTCVSTDVSSWV